MKYLEHPVYTGYGLQEDGAISGRRGVITPFVHHTGYECLTVHHGGGPRSVRSHRFIWECFNGIIEDDSLVINHIDGNKRNNSLHNLELVTSSENAVHAFDTGLRSGMPGESNGSSKLTNDDAREVILMCVKGLTNKHIGSKFGIHPNYVSLIRHKRRWTWLWEEMFGK